MVDTPDGFGTADVRWYPQQTDAPHEIAALYVAHCAVLAIRGQRPRLSVRSLASELGVGKAVTEGWLSGKRMSLEDLMLLAAHFGDAVLRAIPTSQADLLPPDYEPLLSEWERGTPLQLREPPSPASPRWQAVPVVLAAWLRVKQSSGTLRLVTPRDLVLPTMDALVAAGFPPASLMRSAGETGIEVLLRDPLTVELVYIPEGGDAREAGAQIALKIGSLAEAGRQWTAVFVLAAVAHQQLMNLVHADAVPGPALVNLSAVDRDPLPARQVTKPMAVDTFVISILSADK